MSGRICFCVHMNETYIPQIWATLDDTVMSMKTGLVFLLFTAVSLQLVDCSLTSTLYDLNKYSVNKWETKYFMFLPNSFFFQFVFLYEFHSLAFTVNQHWPIWPFFFLPAYLMPYPAFCLFLTSPSVIPSLLSVFLGQSCRTPRKK